MKRFTLTISILFVCIGSVFAQKTGRLIGKVTDANTNEPLVGATVKVVGAYFGAATSVDGSYVIENLPAGDYTIRFTYIGYGEQEHTGITIKAGQTTRLDVKLEDRENTFEVVTVVGAKKLIDLDEGNSGVTLKSKEIQDMNVRDVKEVAALQAGVSETTDGLQIRGARVYESAYLIDNISAQDPLAGTGFGLQVNSRSIGQFQIITGGGGAEYGGGSAGVISTTLAEGQEEWQFSGSWLSDHLGLINNAPWSWNTDYATFSFSGAVPYTKKKLTVFQNASMELTDNYFGHTARQLHSSIMRNDSFWAPRQANNFTHTIKFAYEVKPGTKITLSNQHSLTINQNTRTLQIVGFNAILQPGYQFNRSLNLDNGTTYTHRSNLTALNIQHAINKKLIGRLSIGRLFTNLRADANGRPFRTATVDRLYDEASIVTDPVKVFNPGDPIQFVYPGPGLINNGGISGTWHDHYAREWTVKASLNYYPDNKVHQFNYGLEWKFNEYQWVDVTKPWIGAPIKIDDNTSTPNISIGTSNDIWSVKPNNGALFFTDKITYKSIIASLGMRLNCWAPGKFADDAVNNPNSPVVDQVRKDYKKHTIGMFGMRYKLRALPKINVSFPITANNTMYFFYTHSMRLPHPRFLYAGLDPEYQDRSFLSNLGNPDLNPEINVSYEIGTKSQVTKDFAVTFAAYNNNRFDYIVSRRVIVKDQTGRPVTKVMFINQDYARILGTEVGIQYRVSAYLRSFFNVTYQVARGKSNSARESNLQIEQNGEVSLSKEQYLAWDRPWNIKGGISIHYDTAIHFLPKWTRNMQMFVSVAYQSGYRYTPQVLEGYNDLGRPLYREQVNKYLAERGKPWLKSNLTLSKTFYFKEGKENGLTVKYEVRNLLNYKNAQVINPVTGNAYQAGDDVPNTWRDPRYVGPEETGTPPDDPSRYLAPRQMLLGVSFRF